MSTLVMPSLAQCYVDLAMEGIRSDKGTTHSYIEVYEDLLEPLRNSARSLRVLEVGVLDGASLALWRDYFGPDAEVWGLDVTPPPALVEGTRFVQHDATDPGMLAVLDQRGYDLIVDDASHRYQHQAVTFNILSQMLRPGGLYVIEDVQRAEDVGYIREQTDVAWSLIDRRAVKGRYDDVLMVHTR